MYRETSIGICRCRYLHTATYISRETGAETGTYIYTCTGEDIGTDIRVLKVLMVGFISVLILCDSWLHTTVVWMS